MKTYDKKVSSKSSIEQPNGDNSYNPIILKGSVRTQHPELNNKITTQTYQLVNNNSKQTKHIRKNTYQTYKDSTPTIR
jgi:hypothetical protein